MNTKYTLEDITHEDKKYFPIWRIVEKPGVALVELNVSITNRKPPILLSGLMNDLKRNEIELVVYNLVGPDKDFFAKVHLACGLHKGTNYNLANLSRRNKLDYSFVGISWERALTTDFLLVSALFDRGAPIRDKSYATIDEAINSFS